jgi:hypothetical protein
VIRRSQRVAEPGLVDVDERGAAGLEHCEDLRSIPGAMPELGRHRQRREPFEHPFEQSEVLRGVVKGHRELSEDAAQPAGFGERRHGVEKRPTIPFARLPLVRESAV